MSELLEDKIMIYLREHLEVTCVSGVEIAHQFSTTYRTATKALKELRKGKQLNADDISSKDSLGQGTGNRTVRKYQEPFYVYYLPNGNYLRKKK